MTSHDLMVALEKVIHRVGTIDADVLRKVKARLVEVENALVLERQRVRTLEEALQRARFTAGPGAP